MKKVFLSLSAVAVLAFASCNNTPDATKAEAKDAVAVQDSTAKAAGWNVNVSESKIEWIGSKPIGQHNGTINLKDGSLNVENGKLTGGNFTIDMNSIAVLDITDSAKNAALVSHLKGTGDPQAEDDFFNVKKFPEGKFVITGVADATDADKTKLKDATHVISGNLTLKGIEKNISFPAKVTVTETGAEAYSEMNIDRTNWNIVYNSDETVKDKFINKDINLKLTVKAAK